MRQRFLFYISGFLGNALLPTADFSEVAKFPTDFRTS